MVLFAEASTDSVSIGSTVTLIAGLWGVATVIFSMNKSLHSLRDIVLEVTPLDHLDPTKRYRAKRAAFWGSYLPIFGGILVFLVFFGLFLDSVEDSIERKIAKESKRSDPDSEQISLLKSNKRLTELGMMIPIIGILGFAVGGGLDIWHMRKSIDPTKRLAYATEMAEMAEQGRLTTVPASIKDNDREVSFICIGWIFVGYGRIRRRRDDNRVVVRTTGAGAQ